MPSSLPIFRKFVKLCKDRSWRFMSFVLAFYLVILIGGATIFKAIEEPVEIEGYQQLEAARDAFLTKLNTNCRKNRVIEADVDNFVEAVLKYGSQKVVILDGNASDYNWNMGEAIFFAGTMITTLGYAQTTYLSTHGKIFAIFYICIGVPFTLFIISACVNKVNDLFVWQKNWLAGYWPQKSDLEIKLIHFTIVGATLFISLLIIPAIIFVEVEDGTWSYLQSFYYCFISLTTVGMIEDIPKGGHDKSNKFFYRLTVMIYLYTGLVLVLSALRLFSDLIRMEPEEDDGFTDYIVNQDELSQRRDTRDEQYILQDRTSISSNILNNNTTYDSIASHQ